jgi:L-cysteate sulfo-lyase
MTDPLDALQSFPRLSLAHLPTPLERMPRLGAALGIEHLWVKRDDCTGLGFGGNKVRKLEFDLAAALEQRADCVVCGGVPQSNAARQVAAACAKIGIECHLGIMRGRLASAEPAHAESGNILLDRLYGAVIHDIPWDEDRNLRLNAIVESLRASGRNPYLVPYGASDALGALGYVVAAQEITRELSDGGWPNAVWIVHASGSAGTQAGLLAGLFALGHSARVIGVDVDAQPDRVAADVRRLGRQTASLIGIENRWNDGRVEVVGEWSAGNYGVTDAKTENAIRVAARLEGLALDPVYTGKSMAGLIGLSQQGRFNDGLPVVWIHTGGAPGIFAYPSTMKRLSG